MEAEYYKRYEPFFGGWYIRQLIGEGGYGKVFEIERRDTLGAVFTSALKVITIPPNNSGLEGALSEGMDSESASVYFLDCVKELNREITLMSKLKGHRSAPTPGVWAAKSFLPPPTHRNIWPKSSSGPVHRTLQTATRPLHRCVRSWKLCRSRNPTYPARPVRPSFCRILSARNPTRPPKRSSCRIPPKKA